ncbi:MAG: hypothetical protein BWY76_01459 [bacterium ADurb.Bin429]|nr:MAG: hypothetical protein BWY76_01459 [bacterium ADurb.Bin429]
MVVTAAQPGHLFNTGQPMELAVRLTNPGPAERVAITTRISSSLGCPVYLDMVGVSLPEKGARTETIRFDDARRLPRGPYRVDVVIEGDNAIGYGYTLLNVWDGPATNLNGAFGISYAGPLNAPRTISDLDLFTQAGIGWLRFPLRGWLPQGGNAVPREADIYKQFIGQAKERGFSLMTAFTPTTTVDPSVDMDRANKDYQESLLAAATYFGPQIPYWELLPVKPNPLFPELRGFRAPELLKGREALRTFNKHLICITSLEAPFQATAMDYAAVGLPPKGDLLGITYNFIGLPETREANPKPPLVELPTITQTCQTLLKRTPPTWITEYGFDPAKADRLPSATHQGALMARAFILNRANNIERTFWRHNPANQFDLPLTNSDGSVNPSFLAMRTTLEMLEGTSLVREVPGPDGMHAYLFGKGDLSSKGRKRGKARYLLVMWTSRMPTAATITSEATHISMTDLWGNTVEFDPVDGVILSTIDEFPRFFDLGKSEKAELINPFAHMTPSRVVLQPNGENKFIFNMVNDPRVFRNNHVFEIHFRRWPNTEEVKTYKAPFNYQYDRYDRIFPLTIPDEARRGQVYEVTADIKVAARRVGMLTLPVWYTPEAK